MKRMAVVLSGCGVYDGSEITEAAGVVIALSQAGWQAAFFAPDRNQMHVVDHAKGQQAGESRNMLSESARIARGDIKPLSLLEAGDFDALIFPGGFGAAKNLTRFVELGPAATLFPDVSRVVNAFMQAGKPVAALCAAPLVLGLAARDAGLNGVRITFGHEEEGRDMIAALQAWGQQHEEKPVSEACVDAERKFISVPAYMYGTATPAQVFAACQSAVAAVDQLLVGKFA